MFSAWMLANIHVGRVQPQGAVQHLTADQPEGASDTTPILSAQQPPPITLADQIQAAMDDTSPPASEAKTNGSPVKTYGTAQ
jgi:hypothetical protein